MMIFQEKRKSLDWAVETFRPLMKDLKMGIPDENSLLTTSSYGHMIKNRMDCAVIVVRKCKFSKPEYQGLFLWQYNYKHKIYALYILLNEALYQDTSAESCVRRKAVSTHEFVHVTAALMTTAELQTDELIKRQLEKLRRVFHALESDDIAKLLQDMRLSPQSEDMLNFADSHFRTGDEDFLASYGDLYRHLLLSYKLFRENFDDNKVKCFMDSLQTRTIDGLLVLMESIKTIARDKCLDKHFVTQRVVEEFIYKMIEESRTANSI